MNLFADALETGNVALSTPNAALQSHLGVQHSRIRSYRDVLTTAPSMDQLILALRIAAQTAEVVGSAQTVVEVASTCPESLVLGFARLAASRVRSSPSANRPFC